MSVENITSQIQNGALLDLAQKARSDGAFSHQISALFQSQIQQPAPNATLLLRCIVILPPNEETAAITATFFAKTCKANTLAEMIFAAAETGNHTVMRLVFEKIEALYQQREYKTLIDSSTLNQTPLHLACLNGHAEAAALLLEKGFAPNAKDFDGNTPLHFVCQRNHHQMIPLLTAQGANVHETNKLGLTPLFMAATQETFNALVESGANVRVHDHRGRSPFHYAFLKGRMEIVPLLLQNQAAVMDFDNFLFLPMDLGADPERNRAALPPVYTELRELVFLMKKKMMEECVQRVKSWSNLPDDTFDALVSTAFSSPVLAKELLRMGVDKYKNYRVYQLPGDKTHLLHVSTPQRQLEFVNRFSDAEKGRVLNSRIRTGKERYNTPKEILEQMEQSNPAQYAEVFKDVPSLAITPSEQEIEAFQKIPPIAIALLAREERYIAIMNRAISYMSALQLCVYIPQLSPNQWFESYMDLDPAVQDLILAYSTPEQLQQLKAEDIIGDKYWLISQRVNEIRAKGIKRETLEEVSDKLLACSTDLTYLKIVFNDPFTRSLDNPYLAAQREAVAPLQKAIGEKIAALDQQVNQLKSRLSEIGEGD